MSEKEEMVYEGEEDIFEGLKHDSEKVGLNAPFLGHLSKEDIMELVSEKYAPFCGCYTPENKVLIVERDKNPESSHLEAVLLQGEGRFNLVDFIPHLEGIPYEVKVKAKCYWPDGYEGEVGAEFGERDLTFYVPYLPELDNKIPLNASVKFSFSGLISRMKKAETPDLKFSEGACYEYAKKEFLKNHPDKTAKDFPFVTIKTNEMRMIFNSAYASWYNFRSPIAECKSIQINGAPFYQMKVILGVNTDEPAYFYAYVPHDVCGDYVPTVGDSIDAELWLRGTIDFPNNFVSETPSETIQ